MAACSRSVQSTAGTLVLALPYALKVTSVPIWIESWVHECCGLARRVGESSELFLTLSGDVAGATEPDSLHVLDDGRVKIVGMVAGRTKDSHAGADGTLIASGGVHFAIRGEAPAARVCCVGQLWELRHGFPTGVTRGRLIDIRWRPALLRKVGEQGSVIDGYGPGKELSSTEDWPREGPDNWALELTVWVSS
jgi:hypothetical protein